MEIAYSDTPASSRELKIQEKSILKAQRVKIHFLVGPGCPSPHSHPSSFGKRVNFKYYRPYFIVLSVLLFSIFSYYVHICEFILKFK